MKTRRFLAIVLVPFALGALALAGCVKQNSWPPKVDTYGDPNAWRLSQDEAQCRQLAMRASGSSVKKTAEGTNVGGGAYAGFSTHAAFESDFENCLRARGHQVIQ